MNQHTWTSVTAVLLIGIFASLFGVSRAEEITQPQLLQPPVSIKHICQYRDGGTIGAILSDSAGKTFSFCLDQRIGQENPTLCLGGTYPTIETSQPVSHCDVRFYSTIALLQHIVDQQLSLSQQIVIGTYPKSTDLNAENRKWYLALRIIETLHRHAAQP